MALRPDRFILETDISRYLNEVAERGVVVCVGTPTGSGAALGDSDNYVTVKTTPSGGVPVGILLADMVQIDQTKYHPNYHKEEYDVGHKVPILKKGWVNTNKVLGTPAVGSNAFLDQSGYVSNTFVSSINTPWVGIFRTKKDSDGYAEIDVNLPTQITGP